MRISDWSSDVCSSDLLNDLLRWRGKPITKIEILKLSIAQVQHGNCLIGGDGNMTIGNGILLSGVYILVDLTVAPASAYFASTVSDVATPPNASSVAESNSNFVVTAHSFCQLLQEDR